MALQQDYNYNGAIIKDAYFKIVGFKCQKIGEDYWYYPHISIWANKEMSLDDTKKFRNVLEKQSFILPLDSNDNIIAMLYNALKLTEQFNQAKDI